MRLKTPISVLRALKTPSVLDLRDGLINIGAIDSDIWILGTWLVVLFGGGLGSTA